MNAFSKENRVEFIKRVNWRSFFIIMGWISAVLISSKLSPKEKEFSWFFVIFIISAFAFLLLSKAYTEMLIQQKPKVLTIKEIRRLKLKKLKRKWFQRI